MIDNQGRNYRIKKFICDLSGCLDGHLDGNIFPNFSYLDKSFENDAYTHTHTHTYINFRFIVRLLKIIRVLIGVEREFEKN